MKLIILCIYNVNENDMFMKICEIEVTNLECYVSPYWTFVSWLLKPMIEIPNFVDGLNHIN